MFVLKPIFMGNCDPSKLSSTRLSSSAQDMLFIHYHHFFYGIGISSTNDFLWWIISSLLRFYFSLQQHKICAAEGTELFFLVNLEKSTDCIDFSLHESWPMIKNSGSSKCKKLYKCTWLFSHLKTHYVLEALNLHFVFFEDRSVFPPLNKQSNKMKNAISKRLFLLLLFFSLQWHKYCPSKEPSHSHHLW